MLDKKTLPNIWYKIALTNVGQKTLPNIDYKIVLANVG